MSANDPFQKDGDLHVDPVSNPPPRGGDTSDGEREIGKAPPENTVAVVRSQPPLPADDVVEEVPKCACSTRIGAEDKMDCPVERVGNSLVADMDSPGGECSFTADVTVHYSFTTKKKSDRHTQVEEKIRIPQLDVEVNRSFTHTKPIM